MLTVQVQDISSLFLLGVLSCQELAKEKGDRVVKSYLIVLLLLWVLSYKIRFL